MTDLRKTNRTIKRRGVGFALSTNWCNRRLESGEEIVDVALGLGFEALELGFHTTDFQVKGFKARLDEMPVGSVHAFCPVPISAPQGYPELYSLASFDEEARKMAQFQIRQNIRFAAEMGADALVLHMGRVMCRGWIKRWDFGRRVKRGIKMLDIAKKELELLVPELEANKVTLGLENLPYLEGFPAEWEIGQLCGDWVRPWFDTGHDFVRKSFVPPARALDGTVLGIHINDSVGGDDHLAPGQGKVDFVALKPLAETARHIVFEPHAGISEAELTTGLAYLKSLWEK